ncbi:hypothetical protein HYQ44_015209 [Verticillium longisporum]|nr:hypothetical protein HYQ44_015209 [Verticillium longisporum]
MTKWKKQCDRNMERFDHIRKALARSPDEKYIVHNFEESLMKWRASAEYGDGVKLIAQSGLNPLPCYLSSRPNHSSTPASESVNLGDEDNARANTPQAQTPVSKPPEGDYNPEEDINVHIILYEDSVSLPKENFEARGRETHAEPPARASKGKMELETTNVATILKLGDKYEKSPNRLLELRSKDSLSYVHFPANNMSWIERALDLYYGQDPPSFDGVIHELQEPYNTKTYMMLRPQYWRGQMHGSAGSAPHSRHMRPLCEAISSDTELLSQTPRNMVLFVIDQFSEAIGNSRKETIAYDKLYKWTDNANLIYRRPGNSEMSELHVPLLDINPEAALHREIEDIKEELDIMIYVVRSHLFVLESFITHVKHMLDVDISDDIWGVLSEAISGASADTARGQMPSPSQNTTSPTPNARQAPQPTVYNDPEARKQIFRFFELNAKEVQTKIKWRIKELEQLRDSALSTCEGVKGLLALKQQQAGVVQAWMSLKQSEETVKQGRSIMLFTVVTIVFLPLTFTAAIFGMNALELGSNESLKIGQEFATIFPVSIFIIVITLAIAFSTWIRTFLWSIWHVVANTPYP